MVDYENTEKDIDKILIFMNDCIEQDGSTINTLYFNFIKEDRSIMFDNNWDEDYFYSLLKKCIARRFIEHKSCTDKFFDIALTESGQGRAISACLGKDRHYELDEAKMSIGTLTINGPAQVGHYNIQNFTDLYSNILKGISEAESSDEEKSEAKNIIDKLYENKLINNIVNKMLGWNIK